MDASLLEHSPHGTTASSNDFTGDRGRLGGGEECHNIPDLAGLQNNTGYGGGIVWSHSLTPILTLSAGIDGSRTVNNTEPGTTRQAGVRAALTSPLSAFTDIYGGIRYQIQRSTVSNDYDEAALYVGINHRFR